MQEDLKQQPCLIERLYGRPFLINLVKSSYFINLLIL